MRKGARSAIARGGSAGSEGLEHFPEKWVPVFRKKMRPKQGLLERFSIQSN
jgi:hypothetical protein